MAVRATAAIFVAAVCGSRRGLRAEPSSPQSGTSRCEYDLRADSIADKAPAFKSLAALALFFACAWACG